ncbi:MAG TPA: hypothetical protein PLY45_04235, partial [bacterium]|nr:hypothetical protein [bacterium]
DILAGRSVEGGIVVQSRRGRAHVVEDADGRITWLVKGGDPFGYASLPQVMDSRVALDATAGSAYPDGVLQILQLFRSRRTGDIVLSAEADTAIVAGEGEPEAATHGSLCREHMIVPIIASAAMGAGAMRTVDLFSCVTGMLGIEPEHRMDGVTPVGQEEAKGTSAARE